MKTGGQGLSALVSPRKRGGCRTGCGCARGYLAAVAPGSPTGCLKLSMNLDPLLGASQEAFEAAARAVGFQGFGFYPRSGFIHIDLGPARSWGERFPKRATRLRRGDAAGARGAGREPHAEGRRSGRRRHRSAPPVSRWRRRCWRRRRARSCRSCPTSTRCGGLFIAVALAGIAVAIYARLDDWKNGRR